METTNICSLQELFDAIVARISDSSTASSDSSFASAAAAALSVGTDTKLRLYALYKHCTVGPFQGGTGFTWNPTELVKQRAWLACQNMEQEEAMLEYVQIAASLDSVCQDMLQKYLVKNNDLRSNAQEEEAEDEVIASQTDSERKNESLEILSKESGTDDNQQFPASGSFSSVQKQHKTNWLLEILQLVYCFVSAYLLPTIKPIIPRGSLDISWGDLWFAVFACLRGWCSTTMSLRQQENREQTAIINLWKQKAMAPRYDSGTHVVVGYTARSLLDLYLIQKQYPPQDQKEVIIVPPINIPGMIQILQHHGLQPIAPDNHEPMKVHLEAVRASITDRTVAVMVVHPFGTTSATSEEFQALRQMADEHSLEIWEDAAESFSGVETSGASPYSNLTLISFGLIKTATACGGGIALVRHPADAEAMQRLQNHQYQLQSIDEYLRNKVLQAMLVQFVSRSPTLYGWFAQACLHLGGYDFFDRLITRNVRSLAPAGNSIDRNWLRTIRKRPCLPLLQLLHRRLSQSKQTAWSIARRIRQCKEMIKVIQQHATDVKITSQQRNQLSTSWLFPVQVDHNIKLRIQALLLEEGWDVAAGTSQLQAVSGAPESVQNFMRGTLYLPVASRALCRAQCIDLAQKLQQAISKAKSGTDGGSSSFRRRNDSRMVSRLATWLLVLVLASVVSGKFSVFRCIFLIILPKVFIIVCYGSFLVLGMGYGLQWIVGPFYLELSTGFAQYNSLIDTMGSQSSIRGEASTTENSTDDNSRVLADIPSLHLSRETDSASKFSGCVILTGCTGFIGSLLLRDLLMHRKSLGLNYGVFVLCRSKRSQSARERVDNLLQRDMFSFLSDPEKSELVHVLEGDLTKSNAGLSHEDWARISSLPEHNVVITRVIHSAASVSFTQTLADAGRANITSALTMQTLTGRLGTVLRSNPNYKNLPSPKFIHLSTAFVHGCLSGTEAKPLPQDLFPLGTFDAAKLYDSMLGTQFYAAKAMSDLRFHNTYAFTKCVCEHLLVQKQREKSIPTMIIRPSIVGPALSNPHEGWAGQKPATIVAAGCLYLSYQWNLWCFEAYDIPCVPVDVVSRFILAKAFSLSSINSNLMNVDAISSDSSYDRINLDSLSCASRDGAESSASSLSGRHSYCNDDVEIYNAAWNKSSAKNAMFSWLELGVSTLQLGAVMGYYNRAAAYVGLWVNTQLMPRLHMNVEIYERIHYIAVKAPVQWFLLLCHWFGWETWHSHVSRLNSFLDLPLLFFPYMNAKFYFQSDLVAPTTMNGRRYAFSCAVAAHQFIAISKKKIKGKDRPDATRRTRADHCYHLRSFVIGGREDEESSKSLWWAVTQPNGSLLVRLAGWLFAKILRATCCAVTVDVASFEAILRARLAGAGHTRDGLCIVLAPTHRSFFDFILLSYLTFVIPELHVDQPMIAAADEFERLPLIGWLARLLGAFYIRRGRGIADPKLQASLTSMKKHGVSVFEVFLEGARSRDRRFRTPKTGFLRSLERTGGSHLIVPVGISYERLPEQDILTLEAAGGGKSPGLNHTALFCWLKSVLLGKVSLGNIHIAAGSAVRLGPEKTVDYTRLLDTIQHQQQGVLYVSEYHIEATSRLLQIESALVRDALALLDCNYWPQHCANEHHCLPSFGEDNSELCTVMLQCGPHISTLVREACPQWSLWLSRIIVEQEKCKQRMGNESVQIVSKALVKMLSEAYNGVTKAKSKLEREGFDKPSIQHLLQIAEHEQAQFSVPRVLLRGAASLLLQQALDGEADCIEEDEIQVPDEPHKHRLPESEEILGYWGFHDSGFTLQVDKTGLSYVSMKGQRYSLCGKALYKLLPFVEKETKVSIDPFNEAFKRLIHDARPSGEVYQHIFSDNEWKDLLSTVNKVSVCVTDRTRHNFGHCQEDIYAIRSDSTVRIPDVVVWPKSEMEVMDLIKFAKKHGWCLIPFGGGTSVTQAIRCPPKEVEPRPIISVDMRGMNKVLWLNEEDGVACVEAGITGRALVSALAQRGYTMGHEPDSIEFSTLGGWIATKASGMKQNKYGNIEDIVKDIRMASPIGLVWQHGQDAQSGISCNFGRTSTGMDFRSLMLGSEGCLGIVVSAIVRVWPVPEAKEYDSVLLADFELGIRFVRDVANLGRSMPASVRLLDNAHFRLGQALRFDGASIKEKMMGMLQALTSTWMKGGLDGRSVVCVTISYEGSKSDVSQQRSAMSRLIRSYGGVRLGSDIGKAGYDLTFMIAYLRDFAMTYHFLGESFETFVPWSKVRNVMDFTKERIRKEHMQRCLPGIPFIGCRVTQLYHEGACLYFYFCMSTEGVRNASHVFSEIEHAARTEILQQGGSLSHHHGVGKVRAEFLKEVATPCFRQIVADIKNSMDPDNIFGAGNGLYAKSPPAL